MQIWLAVNAVGDLTPAIADLGDCWGPFQCRRGEPAAPSHGTCAGSAVAWWQGDGSNAYGASVFPFQSSFKSDNLMGPITVSCGQFPLPPPRRFPGRAEIYSHGAATPMGYCSLLLPVSQLAALQMNLPNRGEVFPVSEVLGLLWSPVHLS